MKVFLTSFLAACSIVASAVEKPEQKALPQARAKLEPFLQTYCVRCHGPKKQRGQVRFDTADWEITNNDIAQRWQDVLDQLNGGMSPPFN